MTDYHRHLGGLLQRRCNAEELELTNTSRIVCLPCREETIRGYSHVSLLIIDEAARVPDDLYRAVRPMLAVSNGRMICLSTPYGKRGFFYDCWANGGNDWARIEVPAERCPRITPEFLAGERRALGESTFRQEYCCSFEALEGLVYPDFARCVVTCYVCAVWGCAQFLDEPPALSQPETDEERAWQAYGAILFWLYKPGVSIEQRPTACASWWDRLHSECAFEAVTPLLHLEHVGFGFLPKDTGVAADLCSACPNEIRRILEFALNNRSRVKGRFGLIPCRDDDVAGIIRLLGVVGNRQTVKLLEPFLDTPDLGAHAVETVRRLNAVPGGPN
jgi:hypothetical protein